MKRALVLAYVVMVALSACSPAAPTATPGRAPVPTPPNLPVGGVISSENAGALRHIADLRGHRLSAFALAFSPACAEDDAFCTPYLASIAADGARLWDLNTRSLRAALVEGEGVTHVFFSATPRECAEANAPAADLRVVTVRGDGAVEVWRTPTGELARTFNGHPATIGPAALAPDGVTLTLGGEDGQVVVWNVVTGDRLHTLRGHTGPVTALAFSPVSGLLASAGADSAIRLWDVETGTELGSPGGAPAPATTLAFAPDGKRLAAGTGAQVRVWEIARDGGALAVTDRDPLPVDWGAASAALVFSPDGLFLAIAGSLDDVRLWDLEKNLQGSLPGHDSGALTVDFSPDASVIVTTSFGAPARVWRMRDGQQLAALGDGETPSAAARFSPDGRMIAVDVGGVIQLWGAP